MSGELNILKESLVQLNESMDVYITGYEYPEKMDTLLDLSNHIIHKLDKQLGQKIFKHFGREAISPDGDYTFKDKGIMNFYIKGLDEGTLERLEKQVYKILKDAKIKHGKFGKIETSGAFNSTVIRLPINQMPRVKQDTPPELNMANDTAMFIFNDVLGYEDRGFSFEVDIKDLLTKLDNPAIQFQIGYKERKPGEGTSPVGKALADAMGGKYFDPGLTSKQVIQRIDRIKEIAKWGLKHGYKKLHIA